MPTFRHGRNTVVLINTVDLSAMFNDGSVNRTMEPSEVTCFGNNSKVFIPSLVDANMSFSGFFSGETGEVDAILSAALQTSNDTNVTYGPEGLTIGRTVYIMQSHETSYEISSSVGDAVAVSTEFQSDLGAWSAKSLHALTAETTSTNSTSVDDVASSSTGGVAMLHVTANTMNASTTIKVQHSTDNSVWADLVTFTVVGASTTTSERSTVASGVTINRYLRCTSTMTGTGSITFAVAFGRGSIA